MDRRLFLALAASGLTTASSAMAATRDKDSRRWGLQLFTVLTPLEIDFPGVLKQVAQMGYVEVETIGSFGRDPAYVRDLLDQNGLVSPSQHLSPKDIYSSFRAWSRREISTEENRANYTRAFGLENAMAVVEDGVASAKVMGQTYVTWPILMPAHLADRRTLDAYVALFNAAGALCAREGVVFAYHNHDREFAKVGDEVIYDRILAGTDPNLVKLELDLFWVTKARADPIAYLQRQAGRIKACHLKDMSANGDFAVVGEGVLDVPGLVKAARASGVEHFFVEYDRSNDPLSESRRSLAYLRGLQ